jgi:hypothetical protein
MAEKIKVWEPIKELSGRYWLDKLFFENTKFYFIFKKDKEKSTEVHIICEGGLPSYKYTNESYSFDRTFVHFDGENRAYTLHSWCFYTIEDSPYLTSISKDSAGTSDIIGVKHYCIIGEDEILDIIYPPEPVVELYVDRKLVQSSATRHSE